MMLGVKLVTVSNVCVMPCFFVITRLVVLGCFFVMLGRMAEMLGGFLVMFGCFVSHCVPLRTGLVMRRAEFGGPLSGAYSREMNLS